jgi:hypothetical protein
MISTIKSLLRGRSTHPEFEQQLAQAVQHSIQAAGQSQMTAFVLGDFADRSLLLQGRMAANAQTRGEKVRNLADVEFRVYSQWGEDGIIEWLCAHLPVPNHSFVEFGVESFREANCRFLMHNRNWKSLVIDGSESNIAYLRQQAMYWMHDLTARAAYVTAENINSLLEESGFTGPLGILSIDVDGNDYWIWKAIDVVDPAIVICEYNPILGDARRLVVPYDPNFTRFSAHYSGLYFGASIASLQHLASERGYTFVGTNSNGINAFFVRNDLVEPILSLIADVSAFPSRHRDCRDEEGHLSFVGGVKRFELIKDRPVVNLEMGETILLANIETPYSDRWLFAMT